MGFTPARSPQSFAIVNKSRDVFPITGPTPPYPTNAPCWVAKGPGNLVYGRLSRTCHPYSLPTAKAACFQVDSSARGADGHHRSRGQEVARRHLQCRWQRLCRGIRHRHVRRPYPCGDIEPIGVASFSGVATSQ